MRIIPGQPFNHNPFEMGAGQLAQARRLESMAFEWKCERQVFGVDPEGDAGLEGDAVFARRLLYGVEYGLLRLEDLPEADLCEVD